MALPAGNQLAGKRVALLESRLSDELARLVERRGGEAIRAPDLRELRVADVGQLGSALTEIERTGLDLAVCQTGVGVRLLFELAEQAGLTEVLQRHLGRAVILARGPKPLAALRRRGLKAALKTAEPHTTDEVLDLLRGVELRAAPVAVQHHGAPNDRLVTFLRERGARVVDLVAYRWGLPEDLGPVAAFLLELRAGRVDFVAFTSGAQVENLFEVAAAHGQAGELPGWLNARTRVAAVGPACARALRERGIEVRIQPEHAKLVPLVRALCAAAAEG